MDSRLIWVFVLVAAVAFIVEIVILRWVAPWYGTRIANRILKEIKEGKKVVPRDFIFEICFDSDGFFVKSLKKPGEKTELIPWSIVKRATAFKRDLFRVDRICLSIAMTDEKYIELDKDMKGWIEFTEAIPKHLQGGKPLHEWIYVVATPAFATNPTQVYLKPV